MLPTASSFASYPTSTPVGRPIGGNVGSALCLRAQGILAFRLNHEVDSVLWVPLDFLLETSNRGMHQWQWQEKSLETDCYRYQGHLIWGLSLLMIDELLALIRPRVFCREWCGRHATAAHKASRVALECFEFGVDFTGGDQRCHACFSRQESSDVID